MKKQIGTVLFSNIVTLPTFGAKTGDKYQLVITLDDGQHADAEKAELGLQVGEWNGQSQVKAKFSSKFKLGKKEVVDRYKNPYVDPEGNIKEIPRGSKVAVFTTTKPYTMLGNSGITNYLNAIQVIEESSQIDFEDYSEDLETEDVEF